MPCRVDESYLSENPKTNEELNLVTRMLCDVLNRINECGVVCEDSDLYKHVDGLEKWWEKHKQLDAERQAEEIKKAKAKLTDREKKLLGVK